MTGIGWDILGVMAVGIAMGAIIYAAMHLGRKLGLSGPKWLLPAGIGAAMILYSVWNDYAWYGRAAAQLPDSAEVVATGKGRFPWAPWTYLLPVVVRFAAVDQAEVARSGAIATAPVMLYERRGPGYRVVQEFDCENKAMRRPMGEWAAAEAGDPLMEAICKGG